jgi:predicted metal-dependent phosphotriesterase family hydrolase
LDQGCYLGLDRYPGGNTSSAARTKTLKSLIDLGYAERLCLSHDLSAVYVRTDNPPVTEEERKKRNPHGHLYIKKVVLPELLELGVAREIVENLNVTGPRNFLEGR